MAEHHHHRHHPQRSAAAAAVLDINLTNERESEVSDLFTSIDKNVTSSTATTAVVATTTTTTTTTQSIQSSAEVQSPYSNLEQFDKMFIDLPWNNQAYTIEEEEEEEEAQELRSTDDPILPQKMGQFSIGTANDKESLMKDMKAEIKKIPPYLTKRNKSFQHMLQHARSVITTATTTNNIEELKNMTILIYKIMVIQTYQLLWLAYLKSGKGELRIPSEEQPSYLTTIPIWSKEIKTLLQLTNNPNKANANELYLNFVNKHLLGLDHQLKQYQTEMNIKANNFHGYTLTIQKTIETYIEQHLQSFRKKIEHQIELIHYDCRIRILKLEYLRQNPNKYQDQLMKQTCQSKYEQETTEQEYNLLKQQIDYYNLPNQSFECSPIAYSPLIDSIENPVVRQELFKQYKEAAEQSREALFNVYLQSAEDQREECKKKYENGIEKIRSDQHSLDENQKIPRIMIQLIEQRCDTIGERIKCIYKLKAQSTVH